MAPQTSAQFSFLLATLSGLTLSLMVVLGNPSSSHGDFWVGAVGFALLVAACAIERSARPHQQWLRFVMFIWSVVVTLAFAIAAALTAIDAFGSTTMYVWLGLTAALGGASVLFRPTEPYVVQERK